MNRLDILNSEFKVNAFKVSIFIVVIIVFLLILYLLPDFVKDLYRVNLIQISYFIITIFFFRFLFYDSTFTEELIIDEDEDAMQQEIYKIKYESKFQNKKILIYSLLFLIFLPIFLLYYNIDNKSNSVVYIIIGINSIIWFILIYYSSFLYDFQHLFSKKPKEYTWLYRTFLSFWYVLGILQLFIYLPNSSKPFVLLNRIRVFELIFDLKKLFFLFTIIFLIVNILLRLRKVNKVITPDYLLINYYIIDMNEDNSTMSITFSSVKYILNILFKFINSVIRIIYNLYKYISIIFTKIIINIVNKFASLSISILPTIVFIASLILIMYIINSSSITITTYLSLKSRSQSVQYIPYLITTYIVYLMLLIVGKVVLESYIEERIIINVEKLPFALIYFLFVSALSGLIISLFTEYEFGILGIISFIIIMITILVMLIIEKIYKKDANKKYT